MGLFHNHSSYCPPIYKVKQQIDSICDVLLNNSEAEGNGISPACPAAPDKSDSDAAPAVLGVAQQCDS